MSGRPADLQIAVRGEAPFPRRLVSERGVPSRVQETRSSLPLKRVRRKCWCCVTTFAGKGTARLDRAVFGASSVPSPDNLGGCFDADRCEEPDRPHAFGPCG
jgi:hypothetical protein